MLKFDRLGPGEKVNPNGYAAVLDAAKDPIATLKLDGVGTANGSVRLRNVGTGVVAEGHCALSLEAAKSPEVSASTLDLTATVTRTIPKGASTLDFSDLFSSLAKSEVKKDGASLGENDTVVNSVVTLVPAAAKDTEIAVTVVVATGTATTDNNAATVNIDAGDYQVHFVARAYDTVEDTRMPNQTMMEFVKHCRPLNVRW